MELRTGIETTLANLPNGSLFKDGDTFGLKTEYRTSEGAIEAHILGSGEFYWGGTSDPYVQKNKKVVEVLLSDDSDNKITKFLNSLSREENEMRAKLRFVKEHNFNKEADFISSRLKIVSEIKLELQNIVDCKNETGEVRKFYFD